jgi:tellurite resistance protein TerC
MTERFFIGPRLRQGAAKAKDQELIKRAFHLTYKAARRIVVGMVGATVLLIGVVMLVTPGPALVVIPVGLAILSIEFTFARSWLRRLRESISSRSSDSLNERAKHHRDRVSRD